MKLYIANCTHQNQVVFYRVPENPSPRQQHIEIGHQIQISGDLNPIQIESIINQLRPYGMVAVDEIDRTKPFIGMCYAVDKSIKVDFILRAHEHNSKVLTEMGQKYRQEAAVATNNAVEQNLKGNLKLNALDIEVIEEPRKDGTGSDFSETVRVSRDADPSAAAATAANRSRGKQRAGGSR